MQSARWGKSGHDDGAPDGFAYVALLAEVATTAEPEDKAKISGWLSAHFPKIAALQKDALCYQAQPAYDKNFVN